MMKYLAYTLQTLATERSLEKNYLRRLSSAVIICPMGWGDTFIVCSLVREWKKKNNIQYVTVVCKESHIFIPKMFDSVDCVHIFPKNLRLDAVKQISLRNPKIVYGHFIVQDIVNVLGYKNITLYEAYKARMGFPQETVFEKPHKIDKSSEKKSELFLKANNIDDRRIVLLAPEAVSVEIIDSKFWKLLGEKLEGLGFTIIVNSSKFNFDWISCSSLDGAALRALASRVERVISIRSGLCDIIAYDRARLTVIYPISKWHGGTMLQATGLKGVRQNIHEVEYIERDQAIRSIVSQCS